MKMYSSTHFLKKLQVELPYNSAIPLLGNIPQRTESKGFNRYIYTHVCSSISHNSQKVEATKCALMDEWIIVVYAYNELYILNVCSSLYISDIR